MRQLQPWSISPAEAPPLASPSPPSSAHGCLSANAITILILILCALICSLTLHASVRLFLRSSLVSGRLMLPQAAAAAMDPVSSHECCVKPSESELAVYRSSPRDSRAGAECCAICLAEFEDGEKMRVLATCGHEFHSECVERWWRSRASCPTCRRTCSVEDKAVKKGGQGRRRRCYLRSFDHGSCRNAGLLLNQITP